MRILLSSLNMDIFPEDMVSSATSSPASSLYSPSPSPHGYGSWVQELSHDQQGVRLIGLLYQ